MNAFALALIISHQQPQKTPEQIESALLGTLDKCFWDDQHQHWCEAFGKDDQVLLRGYSVLLSAYAIGTKLDVVTYKPRMEKAFDGLSKYWTAKVPGGYAVLPGQDPNNPDRYYEDNAWVGLAAMEAYDAIKEEKYLRIAERAFDFLKSGEDEKLGGGIYLYENKKDSKSACVNAPAAMLAYKLYAKTSKEAYFEDGNRWLKWTERLIDEKDGLVMDSIKLSGQMDRTKWSHNTSSFLVANWLRGDILRKRDNDTLIPQGMVRNLTTTQSIVTKWLDQDRHLVKGSGVFSMHLFDAFYEENKVFARIMTNGYPRDSSDDGRSYISSIFDNCRNADGLIGEYWNRKPLSKEPLKLMYTAGLLRASLVARRKWYQ